MLNMIRGCRIDDPTRLFEGYQKIENGFVANINADGIQSVFESFIRLHNEYCFVIIEVPTNMKEEPAIGAGGTLPPHKDVYYLDGLTPEKALEFLQVFGQWLIHNGLSAFGIGIHSGANEIVSGKYNVVSIYTNTAEKYDGFFEAHSIFETADLKTAWGFFTYDSPGDSFLYKHEGKTVYDLVEHLKQYGLYFAERREE